MSFRGESCYSGELMKKGKQNEEIILRWLASNSEVREIIDFRDFRLAQRIDVDFGITSVDGDIVLAEIKTLSGRSPTYFLMSVRFLGSAKIMLFCLDVLILHISLIVSF